MNNTCLSHIKLLQAVFQAVFLWPFGLQEYAPLVEGGWRERDEAAVSAWTKACCLHRTHHLHFGKTGSHPSHPSGRPLHHSCCPWVIARRSFLSTESVTKSGAQALAASCTTSAHGPCAGPETIPRSPLLAKVCTKFTHLLLLACPMPDPQWIDISCWQSGSGKTYHWLISGLVIQHDAISFWIELQLGRQE